MSRLLFRLRNVPDEEAAEVRDLLTEHDIDFYETTAGNWGISMPGIWLRHDGDYPAARDLLDAYQADRTQRVRAEYDAARAAGEAETQWQRVRNEPLKVIACLVAIGVLLYLSIAAFF